MNFSCSLISSKQKVTLFFYYLTYLIPFCSVLVSPASTAGGNFTSNQTHFVKKNPHPHPPTSFCFCFPPLKCVYVLKKMQRAFFHLWIQGKWSDFNLCPVIKSIFSYSSLETNLFCVSKNSHMVFWCVWLCLGWLNDQLTLAAIQSRTAAVQRLICLKAVQSSSLICRYFYIRNSSMYRWEHFPLSMN